MILRACRARPLQGWTVQGEMASRGKPGANAEGGFLGGTHSVRPRGEAVCKPRHSILTGTFTMSRWPKGRDLWGGAMPSLRACGARPSTGWTVQGRWPRGENPGLTRKAVFSEGRTPCVRVARPSASRGIPFPPDGLTIRRWPRGHMPRSSRGLPCGRAEPAPPRGGYPSRDGLAAKTLA